MHPSIMTAAEGGVPPKYVRVAAALRRQIADGRLAAESSRACDSAEVPTLPAAGNGRPSLRGDGGAGAGWA